MRICIDLDGVICQLKREGQRYEDLPPVPGAVEKLQDLLSAGHYIIICTARHMKSCQGNPRYGHGPHRPEDAGVAGPPRH